MRKIGPEELHNRLRNHRLWLDTDGRTGERLILINVNLNRANLIGENLVKANFTGSLMEGALLSRATLYEANLRGVNLRHARLQLARLNRANLNGANLQNASLHQADVISASLTNADLRNADLWWANFSGSDLRGADLRGASLHSVTIKDAIIRDTLVSKRTDVARMSSTNYEGFIFDEEDDKKVRDSRARRDAKANDVFEGIGDARFTIALPCDFPPAKLGHVVILISYLYEGIRLALTSLFQDISNLLVQATRPELFGAYEDKHALKIESMQKGSWVVGLVGNKGIACFIKDLRSIREDDILKKFEVMDKAAKLLEDRRKAQMDTLLPVKKDALEEYNSLVAAHQSPTLCDEDRQKLKDSLSRAKARLDNLNERLDVATQVFDQAINELFLVLTRLGGEVLIDGEPLMPMKQIAAK